MILLPFLTASVVGACWFVVDAAFQTTDRRHISYCRLVQKLRFRHNLLLGLVGDNSASRDVG
jgi:hypothetical protein